MFKSNLIAGLISIALLCGFLGVYVFWVPAPPLVIIMILVVSMMIYDFIMEIREIHRNSGD